MASETLSISGGCQCGAVRYRVNAPLGRASICHCRMCQKAFGNLGAPLVAAPFAHFVWTRGKPSEFRSSVPVARGFCAACGTPLYMHEDGDTNIELAICTLDDPNLAWPVENVGIEGKVAWFDTLNALPTDTTEHNNPLAATGRYATRQHPDHDTEHWP